MDRYTRLPQNCALAIAVMCSTVAHADGLDGLGSAIAGGKPNLDVRLRHERVELDGPLAAPLTERDGEATTIRTRLGYTSGKWNDLDAQLEYEGLSVIGSDDYNSLANGNSAYPVIADAKINELNQAWVRYAGLPKTQIKYGRQRILFDNQRFVGNVGWRQTEMTYDAALLTSTLLPKTTFNYAYVSNINSFRFADFDPSPAVALDNDIDIKGHLFNAAFAAIDKKLVVSAYAYLLDFTLGADGAPLGRLFADTQTLGLRASGSVMLDAMTLSYALEYADQQDYADSPATLDASYLSMEAALAWSGIKGSIGHERLEGDGTHSFQTPLATAHAFQGWADQFLVTPLTGLVRSYASVNGAVGPVKLTAVYHVFKSETGGIDYGTEFDLLACYPISETLAVSAKYAAYAADEYPAVAAAGGATVDTHKTWLYVDYKF